MSKISLDKDKIIEVSIGNKVYKPTLNQEKGTLKVLKIPEDEKILRMKSIEIGDSELPLVVEFMEKHLLSTMYGFSGVGVGAMQVGAPIRAFIVDIPKSKITSANEFIDFGDSSYLTSRLENGDSVIIEEVYFVSINNKLVQKSKIIKKFPRIKEVNGKKQLIGIEEEVINDNNASPDLIIERKPYFFLNPKIKMDLTSKIILSEGTPSVPMEIIDKKYNGNTNVKRPCNIELEYFNEKLERKVMKIQGDRHDYWKWFSRCAQHEYDYLEGMLFIDRIKI